MEKKELDEYSERDGILKSYKIKGPAKAKCNYCKREINFSLGVQPLKNHLAIDHSNNLSLYLTVISKSQKLI